MTLIKQIKGESSLTQYLGLQFDDIPPPSADKIREGGFFWLFCIGNPQNFVYFADYKTEKMLYTYISNKDKTFDIGLYVV